MKNRAAPGVPVPRSLLAAERTSIPKSAPTSFLQKSWTPSRMKIFGRAIDLRI
jgi:hypothetical protein